MMYLVVMVDDGDRGGGYDGVILCKCIEGALSPVKCLRWACNNLVRFGNSLIW